MKVERNRAGNRYTFTPEDEKDEKLLDRIAQLEEENKTLRENVNHRAGRCADLSEDKEELREEIRELKAKINKVIELFNEGDSSDLYDYIDDLDYEEI